MGKLAITFVIGSFQEPSSFSLVKLLKKTRRKKKISMKRVKKAKRRKTIPISIRQKSNLGKMRKSASNNRYYEIYCGCLVETNKKIFYPILMRLCIADES